MKWIEDKRFSIFKKLIDTIQERLRPLIIEPASASDSLSLIGVHILL